MKLWERLFEVTIGTVVALAFVAIAVLLGVIAVQAQSGEDTANRRAAALEHTVQGLHATTAVNHQKIGELLADVAALASQLRQLGVPPVVQITVPASPPTSSPAPERVAGPKASPSSTSATSTTTTHRAPTPAPCTTVPVVGGCIP